MRFGMEFNQEKRENFEVVDIFPLAFYMGKVSCHDKIRDSHLEDIKAHLENCDFNGFPGMSFHTLKRFDILFDSLKENFNQYLSVLGVDHTKVSYHIVRCSADIKAPDSDYVADINENRYDIDFSTPPHPHWHNHSDFTFVYYFSADETSDAIYIENCFGNQNDFDGTLLQMGRSDNIMTQWNRYNSKHHIYNPEEGSVIIHPSRLYHYTRRVGKRMKDRIVIGGDVKVTSNIDGTKQMQISPHPSFWREV